MALEVTQSVPRTQKSTGEAKSQLVTKVTQAPGSSADGSTGEAKSQLVTKVVVAEEKPAPKTGPTATTREGGAWEEGDAFVGAAFVAVPAEEEATPAAEETPAT